MHGFRNLNVELESDAQITVLGGQNGQGKTNFVEALYYASTLASFRPAQTEELIGTTSEHALLKIAYNNRPLEGLIQVSLTKPNKREVKVDGKRPRSLHEHLQHVPTVIFHPGHLSLIQGGPEQRRSFLDSILERTDLTYRNALQMYGKALRSRNRLLKQHASVEVIRVYHDILASSGQVIIKARAALVEQLKRLVEESYYFVMGQALSLQMSYAHSVEPDQDTFKRALDEALDKDRLRATTSVGPHLDDLRVEHGSKKARIFSSQGQQRAICLALKLAEQQWLGGFYQRQPVLLLDDVSSELDQERTANFFKLIESLETQIFLTTTHPEYLRIDASRKDYLVQEGRIQEAHYGKQS